ncbi:MAG: hypothetical protein HYY61_06060 [Deltaproteobacteria bacterium]|nr:hypothetical protein [Deltaproteobacteria bacterium]
MECFLILFPLSLCYALSKDPSGKIAEISGKKEEVKIIREKKTKPAILGDILIMEDIAQTGKLSTTKLLLKNPKGKKESVVFVFENSHFRINPSIITAGNKKSTIIEFTKGFLSIISKNLDKDEDIRIKTPNAVIGIRGSQLTLSVQEVCAVESYQAETNLQEKGQAKGGGCPTETSILQASGDIKVLPPTMTTDSLDSPQAQSVLPGTMATITTITTPTSTTDTTTTTPTSSISLTPIALAAPQNVSIMIEANPTPIFDPAQSLTLESVSISSETPLSSTTQTEQSLIAAAEQASSTIAESSTGASSPSSDILSSPGTCP